MKKFLIICLVLFGTILPSFAVHWVEHTRDMFIDTDSITPYVDKYGHKVPYQFTYFEKMLNKGDTLKEDERTYNKKIAYTIFVIVIDIKRKVTAIKGFTTYDLEDKPVYIVDETDSMEWEAIDFFSVDGLLYKELRAKYYPNGL